MRKTAVIERTQKISGIAGAFGIKAWVTYPGEPTECVEFHGSTYGGPVVMIFPSGVQTFVTDPQRHGEFSRKTAVEWVTRFFAERA